MNGQEHPLEISASRDHGTQVLRLRGEIDLENSPQLRERLLDIVQQQPPRMIVDLTGVSYMDSSGVGTLVELKRNLERSGGRLVLVGLQPRVRSVFEITQLDKFFVIAASLAEARKA